jgi:hypothetical protein
VDTVKRPCEVETGRFSELPDRLYRWALFTIVTALALAFNDGLRAQTPAPHPCFEVLTHRMDVDVDGAPNAYGPPGKPTLDALMNAHYLERGDQAIVGYLVDERRHPILQARRIRSPATTFHRQLSRTQPITTSVIHGPTSTPEISTMSCVATRLAGGA